MLDVVNLQDLAKEAMLDFANLMFLPKGALLNCANVQELAKGAPPSSLSIYLILPRERCWISTGTCQGSDAGFRQFTRTCKGSAALKLVNLRDLAKGTMLAFCQSTRPCQGSDMLTFCLPVLAKGAVLDSVDLGELAKAAPRWLWSIYKILPRERC